MIITDIAQLKIRCEPATIFEGQEIIAQLEDELGKSEIRGIGLSAPQIGVSKQVLIVRARENLNLVNPQIIEQYDERIFEEEGCLSFPDTRLTTRRFNEVFVKDLLHPSGIICVGLEAVVIQHEVGHLHMETMFDYEIKVPMRNEWCWCGSGRKFKKCCAGKKINAYGY